MALVNLDDVLVPASRVRKEFPQAELDKLYESILEVGLLHPPVVDKEGFLLAGERRLRCLKRIAEEGKAHFCQGKHLKPGLIFVSTVHDLNHIQRLQAEVDENIVRCDITWQEKAMATEALAKLRAMQASISTGQAVEPDSREIKRKVAEEVAGSEWEEISPGTRQSRTRDVEKDLFIAAWLTHDDEEVRTAKTREEALKLIEQRLVVAGRLARTREFEKEGLKTQHQPLLGNCLEILPTLPEKHFDVLICDPPYGIDADKFGNQSAVPHEYKDKLEEIVHIWMALAEQGFRICKDQAHAYVFCDYRRFETLARVFGDAKWKVWGSPLIWYKGANVGLAPRPEHGPRRTYEAILFASKGDRRVNYCRPDVFTEAHERGVGRAASKPVALYRAILDVSCGPGDRVIDPCCGSGPIFPAASQLNLRATGIEVDEGAFGIALKRIAGEEPDGGGSGSDGSGEGTEPGVEQ